MSVLSSFLTPKTLVWPPAVSSLTKYLQQNRSVFFQSPILIVASEPAAGLSNELHSVQDACKHVSFICAQQLGLRTVSSTISSVFPTTLDLEQRLELAQRSGAGSVIAVGSGAAMDVAKAMKLSNNLNQHHEIENLILVPSTYGALLSSTSSHSLLLDPVEEALVPYPPSPVRNNFTNNNDSNNNNEWVVAPLEPKLTAPVDNLHVILAAISISLDVKYRKDVELYNVADTILTQSVKLLLETSTQDEGVDISILSHEKALEILLLAGSCLSFGSENMDRSIPLALSSSLIPRLFPHVHVITFMASLVPGLCQVFLVDNEDDDDIIDSELISKIQKFSLLAPQLRVASKEHVGFSIPDMSLSHIQANQALWKCLDVPDKILMEVLRHSTNNS